MKEVTNMKTYRAVQALCDFYQRVNTPKVVVGRVYQVRGAGYMQLAEVISDKVGRFNTIYGINVWALFSDMARAATPAEFEKFLVDLKRRVESHAFKPAFQVGDHDEHRRRERR